MTTQKDHLEIRHRGGEDVRIKLGNRDLTPALRSVDIHFRADQTPEVVFRPVVTEWVTVLEGPQLSISADVALILQEAGWASPEQVKAMVFKDAMVMLEQERDGLRDKLASMEEDLANACGHLEDLKLANQTLHDELEEAQAEIRADSRKIPYTA